MPGPQADLHSTSQAHVGELEVCLAKDARRSAPGVVRGPAVRCACAAAAVSLAACAAAAVDPAAHPRLAACESSFCCGRYACPDLPQLH